MFGHTLQDHERDSLIEPCCCLVDDLSDDERKALTREIVGAFVRWQHRQADAKGRVKVVNSGGGLLNLPTTKALVPVGEVEPWQCAGPFVKNDIDLAFRLWLDDDPDFTAILESYRLGKVFASIGLWSKQTAATDSLIRLNGFLVRMIIEEMNEYRQRARSLQEENNAGRRQARENLAKAREVRRRERRRKADELRQDLRTAAFDYWCAHPAASKDDVVAFLRENGFNYRAAGTIKKHIAGVLGDVKKALKSSPRPKTDLYATSQKRNS